MGQALDSGLLSQEVNEVLKQALEYYLQNVRNERAIEGAKAGIELITQDNLKIGHDIEEILGHLKTGLNVSQVVTVESQRQVICDALDAYEIGLKETREAYWKNVGAHPKLRSTDDAISVTQHLKREHCSGRSELSAPPLDSSTP
ncbi:MAG: hypothetical protein OK474_01580 [Thaumarchaeota archaeon]|nr:hypothetical protein [Nitrososphaerota archaeon]